jgi:hypothetical protein
MQTFYEEVIGLRQVVDQGWAKVYEGSKTGHVGLVDERRGMNKWTETKAVNVSFLIDDLDGWFTAVKERALFPLRGAAVSDDEAGRYRAFVGYDPSGTSNHARLRRSGITNCSRTDFGEVATGH